MGAVGQLPTSTYQGDFVAQPGQEGVQNAMGAYNNAAGTAGELSGWGRQQLDRTMGAPQFDIAQVPQSINYNMGDRQANLDQVINAANAPVMRQLREQILPQIRSSALQSGAYSNDRAMGVVPEQAIGAAVRDMAANAQGIGYEDYNNWETRRADMFKSDQQRALDAYGLDTERGLGVGDLGVAQAGQIPGMMDAIIGAGSASGDLYGRAADVDTTARQAAIDNALQREAYGFARPFMGLDTASALMTQLGGNYGTQTQQGTVEQTQKTGGLGNIAQGVLGAGMMGLGLATGGGPLAGLFGGAAKAAGGLGGAAKLFQMPLNASGGFGPNQ